MEQTMVCVGAHLSVLSRRRATRTPRSSSLPCVRASKQLLKAKLDKKLTKRAESILFLLSRRVHLYWRICERLHAVRVSSVCECGANCRRSITQCLIVFATLLHSRLSRALISTTRRAAQSSDCLGCYGMSTALFRLLEPCFRPRPWRPQDRLASFLPHFLSRTAIAALACVDTRTFYARPTTSSRPGIDWSIWCC
ncbi:hypothetical protein BJV77DRAFT_91340 [Russula vinacea]|nr:hypothetical protein BJV77DRAFT_91340 [Russula vinacea]